MPLTDESGVIVDAATEEIVGTWFVNLSKIGFFTEKTKLNDLIESMKQDGVRTIENNYTKQPLHLLPIETIKLTFAAGGYHMLKSEDVTRDQNPINPPVNDFDLEDARWKSNKTYVVRIADNRVVALIRQGAQEPAIVSSIDPRTTRVLDLAFSQDVTAVRRDYDVEGVIAENAQELAPAGLNTFDLQQQLFPDYFVIPAVFVERKQL